MSRHRHPLLTQGMLAALRARNAEPYGISGPALDRSRVSRTPGRLRELGGLSPADRVRAMLAAEAAADGHQAPQDAPGRPTDPEWHSGPGGTASGRHGQSEGHQPTPRAPRPPGTPHPR